jgi:hypothetical protein
MNICPHVRQILKHGGITTLGLWIKTTCNIAANITEYAAVDRRHNKGLPAYGMGGEIAPHHRKKQHITKPDTQTLNWTNNMKHL